MEVILDHFSIETTMRFRNPHPKNGMKKYHMWEMEI